MKMVYGNLVGTGATIYVSLGFKPDYVKIRNVVDFIEVEYNHRDDTNNFGTDIVAAGDKTAAGSAAAGVVQFDNVAGTLAPTSNTAYLVKVASGTYDYEVADDGAALPDGFTIGASSGVNTNGNELIFEAGFYDA